MAKDEGRFEITELHQNHRSKGFFSSSLSSEEPALETVSDGAALPVPLPKRTRSACDIRAPSSTAPAAGHTPQYVRPEFQDVPSCYLFSVANRLDDPSGPDGGRRRHLIASTRQRS